MLFLVYLACITFICVNAEYTVSCNNDTNARGSNNVTLEPSADKVKGRYDMLWCTETFENISTWDYSIKYKTVQMRNQCVAQNPTRPKIFGEPHSQLQQSISLNSNCSHVCLSTTIDLIFQACYFIQNKISGTQQSGKRHQDTVYITNDFRDISILKKIPTFASEDYEEYVSATWTLFSVPAVAYTVELSMPRATSDQQSTVNVTENCTSELYKVSCELHVPYDVGYRLLLTHHAPWTYGDLAVAKVHADFNHTGRALVHVSNEGGALRWVSAGAGAALALCALAALCRRARRRTPLRLKPSAGDAESVEGAGEAGEGSRSGVRVLLLYARDCPLLLVAARRLAALLRHVAPDGVYDLYEAEVSAQAARAPGEWLRALLAHEDVRVLLLQTPAAACLYATQLRQRGYTLALEQPLLGARVLPRRPHCADGLLQLALRLMCEGSAHGAHVDTYYPYKKYYVAQISGLEADVVPLVTPQRRYLLPKATALLLHELAGGAAQPEHVERRLAHLERRLAEPLRQFAQAVGDLLQYVGENPDYLNDELIFL